MKFLADECCDTGLVASLRKDGHDVLYAIEKKAGAIDDEILSDAYKEERILITEDKDFGELVYRFKKPFETFKSFKPFNRSATRNSFKSKGSVLKFAIRISKPGTRPKGGSPKDNFEFERQRAEAEGRKSSTGKS